MPDNDTAERRHVSGDPAGMALSTNIDRRNCSRVVPLEVLALGLPRSGTSSLRQALLDLGYHDCYHFASVMNENPLDARMWMEALKPKLKGQGAPFTRVQWDQLLGHCRAITDIPCVIFYKELIEAYPDAKIVLGIRDDAKQWWESQMHTIVPFMAKFYFSPTTWSAWIYQIFRPRDAVTRLNTFLANECEIFQILRQDWEQGTSKGIQYYEDYNAEIQRVVPKHNLLIFNNTQGWSPLCQFLGKAKPEEKDFPHENTTQEFNDNFRAFENVLDQQVRRNMAAVGTTVVAVLAVGLVLWQKRTV